MLGFIEPMLTRGKKHKSDITDQPNTATPEKGDHNRGKPATTLDDLWKEFKKNQDGNKAIQAQLNTIQTSVNSNTATLNSHIHAYTTEVKSINDKIVQIDDTVTTLDEKYDIIAADIQELRDENIELKKRLYMAENIHQRFVGMEQENKRRNIIIDGIKEAPFHQTKGEIISLLGELDIEASELTVINMYRLGRQRADDKYPRPIMIKFMSNLTKQNLYKNIANLKEI